MAAKKGKSTGKKPAPFMDDEEKEMQGKKKGKAKGKKPAGNGKKGC